MNNKGLTLIEIIISVLIIVIASAGLLGAFFGGHQLMDRSRHRMEALNFAIEAYEKLRTGYNYNDSAMSVGNDHLESEIGTILKADGDFTGLGATLTYDVTEPVTNGYKQVVVEVNWNEREM